MEQQSNFEARGAKIVEQLPAGVGVQTLGRLDFDDELLINHHVEALVGDLDTAIVD